MGSTRYKQHAGGVYILHYHFVWCPKYRRKVLQGAIADRLKALLYEKADELGVTIQGLEVLPITFICSLPHAQPTHRNISPTSSRATRPACFVKSSLV